MITFPIDSQKGVFYFCCSIRSSHLLLTASNEDLSSMSTKKRKEKVRLQICPTGMAVIFLDFYFCLHFYMLCSIRRVLTNNLDLIANGTVYECLQRPVLVVSCNRNYGCSLPIEPHRSTDWSSYKINRNSIVRSTLLHYLVSSE